MPSYNPKLMDLTFPTPTFDLYAAVRKQIAYDGSAREEYLGFTQYAGSMDDQPVWMIYKLVYSGATTNITDQLIPLQGIGFKYAWNDRTTIF